MIIFLKFLLAHFIGDFLIQPDKWVIDKEKKKAKSPKLYLHIGIHTLALLFVFMFDTTYIGGIIFIITTHYAIDVIKLYLQNKKTKRLLFFIDQLLHCAILVIATYIYNESWIDTSIFSNEKILLLLICILFVTYVSSVIIKVIITQWKPEKINQENKESLDKAGKHIGFLERLLVFLFIVIGRWEGVGFLLAAKSVFRFGDLKDKEERRLTEYVLIGTLLSFSLAILAGLVYLHYYGR